MWKDVIETKCFLAENTGYDQMGNLHKSSVGLVFRALLGTPLPRRRRLFDAICSTIWRPVPSRPHYPSDSTLKAAWRG